MNKIELNLDELAKLFTLHVKRLLANKCKVKSKNRLRKEINKWAKAQEPSLILGFFGIDQWVWGASQADLTFFIDKETYDKWKSVAYNKNDINTQWQKFCLRNKVIRIRVLMNDDSTTQLRVRDYHEC